MPDPNLQQLWSDVKELFFVFTDWYKDHRFYHYIGFLTSMGVSIESIWDKAKNNPLMTKDSFLKELKRMIGERIRKTFKYKEEEKKEEKKEEKEEEKKEEKEEEKKEEKEGFFVHSNKSEDDKYCYQTGRAVKELILLYNVQLCLRPDCSERLPFNLYHSSDWDLEHIDSQTKREINSWKEQEEWLKDARLFVNDTGLKKSIESYLDNKEVNEDKFSDLHEQVQEYLGEKDDYSQSIGNLCLLDAKTNRSYQNALYPVKRAKIVERETSGQYVFPGTKLAFMKFFDGAETSRVTVWSQNDKVAFEKHIYTTIKDFL